MGEEYDLRYARRAMMLLVTLPVAVMYTEAVLIPSLPTIQREFGVSPSSVSWVLSIYLLTGTISVAVLGKLGDMYGKKKLFILALSIYTAGVTLTGFAPTFPLLLAARALQGLGMAIFPLGYTIVREEFPPEMVPQVQGLISAMYGVGMVIAFPVGGYIADRYGWRWTYHSVVPFIVALLLLSVWMLRESRYITPGRLDIPGVALLSLFDISALVAVTRAPIVGWASPSTLALLALSLAGLVLFLAWEGRAGDPLIPPSILSTRNVLVTYIGIFLAGFAMQMMGQAVMYLFQMKPPYGYGKDILQSGLLMTPMALTMLVVAPLIGRLMVRVGAKPFVQAGAVIAIIGLLLLSRSPTTLGIWRVVGLLVVIGVGLTALSMSLINILIFSVDKRVMGIATGLNSLFRNLGAAWGPAIAGTFMSMYSTMIPLGLGARVVYLRIPKPIAYRYLFTLTAVFYTLLLAISFYLREVVKMEKHPGEAAYTRP